MIASLRLDATRSAQIRVFMETYLKLTTQENMQYNAEYAALRPEEREAIVEMVYEWDRAAVEKGMERGGKLKSVEVALRQLSHRFGRLEASLQQCIRQLPESDLDELLVTLLGFQSIAEAQTWVDRRTA